MFRQMVFMCALDLYDRGGWCIADVWIGHLGCDGVAVVDTGTSAGQSNIRAEC